MRPPCNIEDSGWFEQGINANCQAQVPHILALAFVLVLIGVLAAMYWWVRRG